MTAEYDGTTAGEPSSQDSLHDGRNDEASHGGAEDEWRPLTELRDGERSTDDEGDGGAGSAADDERDGEARNAADDERDGARDVPIDHPLAPGLFRG